MSVKNSRKRATSLRPKARRARSPAEIVEEQPDVSEEDNETEPGAATLPPEAEPIGRRIEQEFEEEDDFADGRSSGSFKMRAEEDEWGRGTDPDERPFEESDVPPRSELGAESGVEEEARTEERQAGSQEERRDKKAGRRSGRGG